MKLPLFEEIRAARRLAEEAQQAAVHLQRISAALMSARIVEQQLQRRPELSCPAPGDDILRDVARSWPQLGHLGGQRPDTEGSLASVAARRAVLQQAEQVLRPLAAEASTRARHLHDLQHEQNEQLADARWADAVAELAELGVRRKDVAAQLAPLDQRLAALKPAAEVLATFVLRLDGELADRDAEDPTGHRAWRAASVANGLVDNLGTLLDRLSLGLSTPALASIPERPTPEYCGRLWAEVTRVRAELDDLRGLVEADRGSQQQKRDAQARRYEQLSQQIADRMG